MQTELPARRYDKLMAMVQFADAVRGQSTCARHQHAAIIATQDFNRIIGFSPNGVPAGLPHGLCSGDTDPCVCVHAEVAALLNAHWPAQTWLPAIMYVTAEPCAKCAGAIINTRGKVNTVIVGDGLSSTAHPGTGLLTAAGVLVVPLHEIAREQP